VSASVADTTAVGTATYDQQRTDAAPSAVAGRTVAYVVSRFPKLTETFVLYELLALEDLEVHVELYPLLREHEPVAHPEAAALVARAHYEPFLSLAILGSNVRMLLRRPRGYFGALWTVARGAFGSLNYLAGGLAIFPKVVHAATSMEEEGVTHVHCHFANHPATAGLIVHRLTGIPFSFTAHGSDLHRDRRLLREKAREAERVFTISDYNRRLIEDECGSEAERKVTVLHCGADTSLFHPGARPRRTGSLAVVCVASLQEVKGHRYLLDACRVLLDRGVEFNCRLVGDGPLRVALETQIAELDLGGHVHLEGPRARPQVAEILGGADIAVCPSAPTSKGDREGIPVALMEAMATGLAVVASDISGIPELVDDDETGLLVPPGDASALADAITRLHEDSALRTRLGEAARARVVHDFDLRRNAAALAPLLVEESAS
jgi:glycosyltransferase involved in cell wall biosynthesis